VDLFLIFSLLFAVEVYGIIPTANIGHMWLPFNLFLLSFQLAIWFFTTFTASDLKSKVFNIKGVQYLYGTISPDQLDIPSFVIKYDTEVSPLFMYVCLSRLVTQHKSKSIINVCHWHGSSRPIVSPISFKDQHT